MDEKSNVKKIRGEQFMKKVLKRSVLSLLLTVLCFAGFLPGCSTLPDKSTDKDLPEKNLKEVTLTFYFSGSENLQSRKVLDRVEKETKNTLNIRLDFKWIPWNEFQNTINALFQSGDNFDALASMYDGDYNMQFYKMAQEGSLLNISELFPEYAPELFSKYSKEELRQVTYQGKIQGVPARLPGSFRVCAVVRKDLMDKYGIPPIKTINDYDSFLQTVNNIWMNSLQIRKMPVSAILLKCCKNNWMNGKRIMSNFI